MRGRRAYEDLVESLTADYHDPAVRAEARRILNSWHRTFSRMGAPYSGEQRTVLKVVLRAAIAAMRNGDPLAKYESHAAQVAVGEALKAGRALSTYTYLEMVQSARRGAFYASPEKMYPISFPRVWKLSDSFWVGRYTGRAEHAPALAAVGRALGHCYSEEGAIAEYTRMALLFTGFEIIKSRSGKMTTKPRWTAAISKLDYRLTEVRQQGNVWIDSKNVRTFAAFMARLQKGGHFQQVNDRSSSWPAVQFFNHYNCQGTQYVSCPIEGSGGQFVVIVRHAGGCDLHNHPLYKPYISVTNTGEELFSEVIFNTPALAGPIWARLRLSNPEFQYDHTHSWRITDALLVGHVLAEAVMKRTERVPHRVSSWNEEIRREDRERHEALMRAREVAEDDDDGDDDYYDGNDDDDY